MQKSIPLHIAKSINDKVRFSMLCMEDVTIITQRSIFANKCQEKELSDKFK